MPRKWSEKTVKCENLTVQLTSVLSERYVYDIGECVVVADGKCVAVLDGEPEEIDRLVVVKMRVQLDPETVNDDDREVAMRAAATEWAALIESADSGHTPRSLALGTTLQDQSMPYPGGYIHVLVMSKVPGRNVQQILFDLTEEERVTIRNQLASTLEYMRLKGWIYYDPKPSNLIWDQKTSHMYLVDLEAVHYLGKAAGDRITPESGIVKMFKV